MGNLGNLRSKHRFFHKVLFFTLGVAIALSSHNPSVLSRGAPVEQILPPLMSHPVPEPLMSFAPAENNYFDQIQPTNLGYLLWSEFPVKVYIDLPSHLDQTIASDGRLIRWGQAVHQGIEEWGRYFPLQVTADQAIADITIKPVRPALQGKIINPETGLFELPRARAATTNYELYLTSDQPPRLKHRMTIEIKPGQGQETTLGSVRHELGHALGLWGHSDGAEDVLYPEQVADPPPISPRDVATLKQIYLQPTRLGSPLQL